MSTEAAHLKLGKNYIHKLLHFWAGIITKHVEDGCPDVAHLHLVACSLTKNLCQCIYVQVLILQLLPRLLQIL